MYRRLDEGSGPVVGYEISRPLSAEEIREITAQLEGMIAEQGRIRVLLELGSFPYLDWAAFWEDLKFDARHARDLERLALVGAQPLEKLATRIFGILTLTRCRFFDSSEKAAAWAWLRA